jgi:hypothetical protein
MRKALIAAAVATALFAVGAFAASFAVDSEDIASGSDGVVACADKVLVDFGTPTYDSTTHKWSVNTAVLTFQTTAGAADPDCAGFVATARISTSTAADQDVEWTHAGTIPTGNTVTVTGAAVEVSVVNGAAVLVDGKHLGTSAITP